MENFLQSLENNTNISVTENGALGYATTKSTLVDTMFNITSFRRKSKNEIVNTLLEIFKEEGLDTTLKFLFFIRDCRGGLGERKFFREGFYGFLEWILTINNHPQFDTDLLLDLVVEYGRYDDLFFNMDRFWQVKVVNYICKNLALDITNHNNKNYNKVSLLAKWLPSHNKKDETSRKIIEGIKSKLNITERQYRKMLSSLRYDIKVVEKFMSANKWEKIDYSGVPSKAHLNYRNAFRRQDEERYVDYLDSLEKGETKINSSTLYPYEIITRYFEDMDYWDTRNLMNLDTTLEEMWKALPVLKFNENVLVVRDGSGSMYGYDGHVGAIDVADSLTILFSENNKGVFKDKFLTFSEKPKYVDLSDKESLVDKLHTLRNEDEVANTNIEAVFQLVLQSALENNLSQEEIPTILIISDMEFDNATCTNAGEWGTPNMRLFDTFKAKFAERGYKLPKMIFWNVEGSSGTIPVKENDLGVTLISGFSQSIFDMVLNQKTDPREVILDKLNSERYRRVEDVFN